ncbi:AAA family ATPase [Limosilactobacillus pontis]|uniref:AAA family ATPase n=1 Tax=Limosilactobacillus pontis TaxID=35787 RepID=A0ABT7UZ79_9LACO|nr:AAA family ATPase [Limosilactobacillus pontis]MDM8267013.1 AAA family ATPase [Limosilactobacillus pontis]
MKEIVEIVGSIERERYRNGDFCIATMRVSEVRQGVLKRANDGNVIFKGDMRMIPQKEYIIRGRYEDNKKFGPQYQFLSNKLKNPIEDMSAKEFRQFLTDLSPYGVRINKAYEDARKIFEEHNLEALTKIDGIGNVRAKELLDKYDSQRDYSPVYVEFAKYGFSTKVAKRAIDYYSSIDTPIERLKKNPYDLMEIPGLGFKKIDDKCLEHGIAENDPRRIKAFLVDYFEQLEMDSKSWIPVAQLKAYLRNEIFNCDIAETFKKLNADKNFVIFEREDEKRIALRTIYEMEKKVAEELLRIKNGSSDVELQDVDKVIGDIEKEQGWSYSTEQRDAIDTMLKENVVILRGPGGVGKTTTLNAVIKVLRHNNISVATCALAGKAAENLTQVTGLRGQTIHRLLGIGSPFELKDQGLEYDVVILDELSMVNISLFSELVRTIPTGAKLIMVGDSAQLDSIGIGVMRDAIASGTIPVITLNKIHRQAQESAIITHSLAFRAGNLPDGLSVKANWHMMGKRRDLGYVFEDDEKNLLGDACKIFKYALKQYDVKDIQIVSQTTRNCLMLNKAAQQIANPQKDQDYYVVYEGKEYEYTLRVGDKVINTRNNYRTPDADRSSAFLPIFNGNTGTIESIDLEKGNKGEESLRMIVDFDGIGRVVIDSGTVTNIQLGYAITVHKSQGSTIPCVIVALPFQYVLNTRELLYTAITRASKVCYLVTSMKTLRSTVKKTSGVKAKSNLVYFLKEMEAKNSEV